MALYKQGQLLKQSNHEAFDKKHSPGASAPYHGIYRCTACGDEIAIAAGNTLPPQNHHQHNPNTGNIEWQLLVYSEQKK
ncbi:MAG TPA: protein L [Lentisphaeria bacterium]|nr:MAG: hypothetical protein A2X45_07835 [Lentisphaerae bacterium GWF2_50_93]HCE44318.1 protein L [Lentisphaeria bacterium]